MIVLQSELDMGAAKELADNLGFLPKGDQAFAADLLHTLSLKGKLSEKQWLWVRKLAEEAEQTMLPDFTVGAGLPPTAAPMAAILPLFDKAHKYLKYPKIKLEMNGVTVQLALAGKLSSQPGSISVTDGKGYGGNGVFFGRVGTDGQWTANAKAGLAGATSMVALEALLTALAANPQGTVATFGKQTGKCAFCLIPLTDTRSVKAGYGKICAKTWGLPYPTAAEMAA